MQFVSVSIFDARRDFAMRRWQDMPRERNAFVNCGFWGVRSVPAASTFGRARALTDDEGTDEFIKEMYRGKFS